jgi:predicted nucleic acid-binding protein
VKTIVEEPASARLEVWLGRRPDRISSALLRTEAIRAVRPHGLAAIERARQGIAAIDLITIEDRVLDAAAELAPDVRSLDAIHLASALELGSDLAAVVTYDERMVRAAGELGLEAVSP